MRAKFFDLLISVVRFSRLFICTKHVQNVYFPLQLLFKAQVFQLNVLEVIEPNAENY